MIMVMTSVHTDITLRFIHGSFVGAAPGRLDDLLSHY